MKCSILCDASKRIKQTVWEKIIKSPILSEYNTDSFYISILYLPYTWTELKQLTPKKATKQWIRAANILISEGVEYLYLPDVCMEFDELQNTLNPLFKICDGKEVYLRTAHKALECWMKKEEANPDSFELGIYRRSFDHQANNLLLSLCQDLKYITLFCEDKTGAMVYADNIAMQTGLCASVSDNFAQDHHRCRVIILLDPPPPSCKFGEHQVIIDIKGITVIVSTQKSLHALLNLLQSNNFLIDVISGLPPLY